SAAGGSGSGGGADAGAGASGGGGKNGDPAGGTGNSAAGAGSWGGGGGQVPANSELPTCPPSAVQWEVRSVKNEYAAGERPRLELLARNTSGSSCKVDLGPKQAVLTILQASGNKAVWSSDHCPRGAGNAFFKLPAQGQTTQALEWDRTFSAAGQCQAPPAGNAGPDTYVVEVKAPGMPVARTSFVLKQD
ncbi:hypothetical protein, partial [Streptomyces bambusae]